MYKQKKTRYKSFFSIVRYKSCCYGFGKIKNNNNKKHKLRTWKTILQ